ncbi:hypothetical protein PQR34_42895 [Paraburkholderia sediminicola]|uniref:hypothetical protein n=1 Tax=Paraburkholderia sediminicola TaxID=458836 RepID=UPI0038BDDBD2
MKKMTIFALSAVMLFALAGCSKRDHGPGNVDKSQESRGGEAAQGAGNVPRGPEDPQLDLR